MKTRTKYIITLITLAIMSTIATVLYIEKSEIERQLEIYKQRTRRQRTLSPKKYITVSQVDLSDRNYIKLSDVTLDKSDKE